MVSMLNAVPTGQMAAVIILAVLAVLIWVFFILTFTKPFKQKFFGQKAAQSVASESSAEPSTEKKSDAATEAAAAEAAGPTEKHIYIHHVYDNEPAAEPAPAPSPAPAAPAATPTPAPAPAAKKKPVVDDDDDDDDDDHEYGVIMVDDRPVRVAYRKSFQARLIESTDEIKGYYCQVANHVLSYRLKGRVSWGYLSFNNGKDAFCKFNVENKTLCVYYALNYKEFKESEEFNVEKAKTKKYEKTPVMMRVTSLKSAKSAMDLIDLMAGRVGLKRGSDVKVEKVEKYPLDSKENLIQRGLIKYTVIEGDPNSVE